MAPSVLLKAAVLLLLLVVGGAIGVSCIPERRAPAPPGPPAPRAVQPEIPMRDLAGRERDPKRGITPGALEVEAEAPPGVSAN